MRIVITIFNNDLDRKAAVKAEINKLCDTKEIVDACLYIPRTGMLAVFIKLLAANNIQYYFGVHLSRPRSE